MKLSMTTKHALAAAAFLALSMPAAAQVKTDHLIGKFSTTDNGCKDETTQDFEIRRGIIEGPNIFCILGATRPPDQGTEAYEAKCTLKGGVRLGTLTFDLSGKPERIRIALPESQEWITLYACR